MTSVAVYNRGMKCVCLVTFLETTVGTVVVKASRKKNPISLQLRLVASIVVGRTKAMLQET